MNLSMASLFDVLLEAVLHSSCLCLHVLSIANAPTATAATGTTNNALSIIQRFDFFLFIIMILCFSEPRLRLLANGCRRLPTALTTRNFWYCVASMPLLMTASSASYSCMVLSSFASSHAKGLNHCRALARVIVVRSA